MRYSAGLPKSLSSLFLQAGNVHIVKNTKRVNVRKMLKAVEKRYVNLGAESRYFCAENSPVKKSVDNVEKSCFSTGILKF